MYYSKLRIGALLLWLLCTGRAEAQNLFSSLDLSPCSTGLLWDKAISMTDPPDGSDFDTLSFTRSAHILQKFHKASINEEQALVPDYPSLFSSLENALMEESCIPMVLSEMRYNRISQEAADNGWIQVVNNQFVQSNTAQNIFSESSTLVLHLGVKDYASHNLKFVLKSEHYYSNYLSPPDAILMDFDDGVGWRTITLDLPVDVHYSTTGSERQIRVRCLRGTEEKRAGTELEVTICASQYDSPVWPVPWQTVEANNMPDNHWRIATEFEGQFVAGNAYYLPTGDFDKPFIFVEGIDFLYHPQPQKNGEFGWCQFTSGIDNLGYDYAMLAKMPFFLDDLRSHGYDIILLDFEKGAEDIRLNAKLLEHLIELVNATKTGSQPNVLAGASMGGVVSRYALRDIELNGLDHCTRLYISFDAPHQGANIPLSIQQFLAGLESPDSYETIQQKLMRPAARQLLKYQYFVADSDNPFNPAERAVFQEMLDEMGMPQQCRKIALANGSGDGLRQKNKEGIDCGDGDNILDRWTSDLFPCNDIPELQFYIANSAGKHEYSDDWTTNINPGYNISASVVLPDAPNALSVGIAAGNAGISFGPLGFIGSLFAGYCLDVASPNYFSVPENTVSWDFAPGGSRDTAVELVEKLMKTLDDEVPSWTFADVTIPESMINENHCFIATSSALGIQTNDPFLNVSNLEETSEGFIEFDSRYFAPAFNEQHVELTDSNMDYLKGEIMNGENEEGMWLLSDWVNAIGDAENVFNFGLTSFNFLQSIEVYNDASITINHQGPLHYGEESLADAIREDNYKMTTSYGCESTLIDIHHGGLLSVGDPDPSFSAQMRVLRDAKITVSTGGVLEINEGSKMIFEEGSELELRTGSTLVINGGSLVMKTGSLIVYSGGDVYLNGDEAFIIFDGGQIYLEEGAVFQPLFNMESSGEIVVMPGTSDVLHMENNSVFRLTGSASDDVVLDVINGARFENAIPGVGQVELNNCRVSLHNNGEFFVELPVIADNVDFRAYPGEEGRGWIWSRSSLFSAVNSSFSDVFLETNEAKLLLDKCTLTGIDCGVDALEGFFVIDDCRFLNCGLKSESLTLTSHIHRSEFSGNANTGIDDNSPVELDVKECVFENCDEYAIRKTDGKLSLGCSVMMHNKGLYVQNAILNMSGQEGAGNNDFYDVERCAYLSSVPEILLIDGGNSFTGFNLQCFSGSINQPCGDKYACELLVAATGNFWGYDGVMVAQPWNALSGPDPDQIDVTASEIVPCAGYENTSACQVIFYDVLPQLPPPCDSNGRKRINIEEKEKRSDAGDILAQSNPLLYTPNFQGIALDSALTVAADGLSGEDPQEMIAGIELFREILTSDIDKTFRETREALTRARSWMKTGIEYLFTKGVLKPVNNLSSFEEPVQDYVDVLNALTDTVLTDSTYKDQFYLELDKAQLFRSLGRTEIANEVLAHLGDCRLDSLEQVIINKWRKQTELEISIEHQLNLDDITPDSINTDVDTTGYHLPVKYLQSNYYFGLWIYDPNSYVFVSCGAEPYYRNSQLTEAPAFKVYPNPSDDHCFISGLETGYYDICFRDAQGRSVFEMNYAVASPQDIVSIPVYGLSSGIYLLETRRGDKAERTVVEIQH